MTAQRVFSSAARRRVLAALPVTAVGSIALAGCPTATPGTTTDKEPTRPHTVTPPRTTMPHRPGDIPQANSADEWVALEQLQQYAETIHRIVSGGHA